MNTRNPETQRSKNYHCGQVLFDREGVFSNCSPTYYQLLSRDGGEWTCAFHRASFVGKDGIPKAGALVQVVYNVDLDKAEIIGYVQLPMESPT